MFKRCFFYVVGGEKETLKKRKKKVNMKKIEKKNEKNFLLSVCVCVCISPLPWHQNFCCHTLFFPILFFLDWQAFNLAHPCIVLTNTESISHFDYLPILCLSLVIDFSLFQSWYFLIIKSFYGKTKHYLLLVQIYLH